MIIPTNLRKIDKVPKYPVGWSLSRNSTALTMQYTEVQAEEPVYERIIQSPMAFQDIQPYSSGLTDATIQPTYASVVADIEALDATYTNVVVDDISTITGATVLPSGRKMLTVRINDDGVKPIICLHTCTHGGENHSFTGVLSFIDHYLTSNDALSVWLRETVSLVWLAIPNPDGLFSDNRRNDNNINLNRNYPYFWDYAADPDKGAAPLDQNETANMINFLTVEMMGRIISFLDIHGWFSRSTYGFLTDQIWEGDIRALKQQRAAYLYMKSIMDKRDWASEFTIVNALPTPVERRSSRKPYISYAIRKHCKSTAWTGQFEYSHQENVGVGGTAVLDAITGVCMAARDGLVSESIGVVSTGLFAPTDIVNNNSHFDDAWNVSENRPPWFKYESLSVQNNTLVNPHYTETQVVINRPLSSSWPILFTNAGETVNADPLLETGGHVYIVGGEVSSGTYTNDFYREQLVQPEPPQIGDNNYGIYLPEIEQEQLPNLPYSAKGVKLANDGTYIYAFGGFDGTYHAEIYRIAIAGVDTNSWTLVHTMTSYGGEGLNRHSMDFWNGNLVITGGRTSIGYEDKTILVDVSTWSETIIVRSSNDIDPFFSARGWHSTVLVGDLLYVIGGWTGTTTLLSVYEINLVTRGRFYRPLPSARRQASAAYSADTDKIYVIGGCSGSTTTPTYLDALEFDRATDTWSDYVHSLDTFVDEDGDTVTIDPMLRLNPIMYYNPLSYQLIFAGGESAVDVSTATVYEILLSSSLVSLRETNDANYGLIRPNSIFPSVEGEVYVLNIAAERLDAIDPQVNAYLRPCIYSGNWATPIRKNRLGYSVPPNKGVHIYSIPVQAHAGFDPEIRGFLRHYGSGTRVVLGAMQITKGQLHGTLIPETGKASDVVTVSFDNMVDTNNEAYGVMSPMWGSQQATNGDLTAIDFTVDGANDLDLLSLTYSATADGVYTDPNSYIDFSPNGNFTLRWTENATPHTHVFTTVELNHDRYAPAWRKDVFHWRLRYSGADLVFDLWFYNEMQTVNLGAITSDITGFTIDGANAVCKVQ